VVSFLYCLLFQFVFCPIFSSVVNGTVIAYVCWPLRIYSLWVTRCWPTAGHHVCRRCRCPDVDVQHDSIHMALCYVWSIHVSVTACRWSHWSVMMLSCSPQFDKSEYSVGHQHHGVIRRLHWLAVHQQITYKIAGVSHYISWEPLALLLTSLIWFQTTNQNGHYDPLINCYCLYRGLHLCCQLKPSASVFLQSA